MANAICWQSRQSQKICDDLIARGYEDMIYQKTGLHINPYFSASKIRYLIDNNQNIKDLYDAGKVLFGTMDTYILYRLTNGASLKRMRLMLLEQCFIIFIRYPMMMSF